MPGSYKGERAFLYILLIFSQSKASDDETMSTNISLQASRQRMDTKVTRIGFWLRQHKFNEVDQRYALTKKQKEELVPYFVESFPKPRLRQLTESLARACRLGVEECIDEIYTFYSQTPYGRIADKDQTYINKLKQRFTDSSEKTKRQIQYEPYKNKLKLFQFRATATYFMCHYTMQRKAEVLKHFTCDNNNGIVNARKGTVYYTAKNEDYRANQDIEFSCGMYSFCPDVCCGKISGDLESATRCMQSAVNPCRFVGDGVCKVDQYKNTNFMDMVDNQINYTCNCEQEKPGYIWSMEFGQCVDRDECSDYRFTDECTNEGQTCQNTIGSFICTCRWGFSRRNETSDDCVLDDEIGYRAVLKTKKNKEEIIDEDSIYNFKIKPIKKKNIPWTVKAIYKLNYFSAFLMNHTMQFYNLAGLESWAQSWNSAKQPAPLDLYVIFLYIVTLGILL